MTCGDERNSTGSPCLRTKSEIEKPAKGRVGAGSAVFDRFRRFALGSLSAGDAASVP
jgi:hypothetical protein